MHTAGSGRCLLFPPVENQPQKNAACPACRTVAQLRALSGTALPWHLASAYRTQLSPPRRGLSLSSGTSVLLDLRAGSPGQLPGPREAGAHGAPDDYFIPGQPFFFCYLISIAAWQRWNLNSHRCHVRERLSSSFGQYFFEVSRFSDRTSS